MSSTDPLDLQKIEIKLAVVERELAEQQEHCYLMCRLRDVFNDKTNKTIAELDEYCSQMFGYQEEINDETITTLKRHSWTLWCVLIISALAMAISIAALCIVRNTHQNQPQNREIIHEITAIPMGTSIPAMAILFPHEAILLPSRCNSLSCCLSSSCGVFCRFAALALKCSCTLATSSSVMGGSDSLSSRIRSAVFSPCSRASIIFFDIRSSDFIVSPFLDVRLFFGDYYSTPFREGFLLAGNAGKGGAV